MTTSTETAGKPDALLTTAETAAMLGLKINTLEIWRGKGKGPTFCKMGDGLGAPVRYWHSDVVAWLEARQYGSTSHFTAKQSFPAGQRPRPQAVRVAPASAVAPNAPWLSANA